MSEKNKIEITTLKNVKPFTITSTGMLELSHFNLFEEDEIEPAKKILNVLDEKNIVLAVSLLRKCENVICRNSIFRAHPQNDLQI